MKNYVVYNNLGCILKVGNCQDIDIELQAGKNEFVIEGEAQLDLCYVENGEIIAMPTKPTGFYKWDYSQKAWVQDYNAADAAARNKRGNLLRSSDWTQLADVPLTNKEAWATYRQELRDIPEQSGYPFNINYPTPPQ